MQLPKPFGVQCLYEDAAKLVERLDALVPQLEAALERLEAETAKRDNRNDS